MAIEHIHALPPGTRFEEYRLDAVLGAGGFGITYRAYDAHLDKFVAIKEYLPGEFAARTEASTVVPKSNTDAQDYHWGLSRFLDEARTLARFDHPHLNRVHRFFESNGTAYMVLEYIDGETLADRLSREPYLEEDALQRLLEEVLSGLEVMHEAGYVHRDIKPGNLMLRAEDGSAVVLDFGAARQAVGQRSKPITSILTPGYAPIEQYDSKADDVGPWSDMYALGMVAYRCISGLGDSELPDAVTRGRTQRKGQVDLVPAKEAGKGKYSPKLLEAIDWAMAVDEGDRPQTVDAWRQALTGGSRRQGPAKSVRKSTTQTPQGTTTGRAGTNWSGVALTAMIVALLGVGAWWGWQAYPEWFGQSAGGAPPLAQQEAPADASEETLQETVTGDASETVAGAEDTPDRPAIEQPAPKEPALSAEQAEVARLLAAAEADLKARRLTSPAGNNAWEKYQAVLKLDSGNPEAMSGMERVIESYRELFGAAVEQEDFDKAAGYLAKIRELHPDSPVLEEGERRLEATKQVRAERLAEIERQRQAEEAARQAALERQRIAKVIEGHWKAFEAVLGEENLSDAADILAQVRALHPEEPGLAAGERRLESLRAELERQRAEAIQAHWTAFESALEAEDLDEAARILARARALNPEESGLAAGEQRLAATQAALERKRQAADAKTRELVGDMVSIPGGSFRMGDLSGEGGDSEKPVHSVTVSAFRLGKHEVTVGQFRRFVEAAGYRTDAERNADGNAGCRTYTGDGWDWTSGRSWRNPGFSVGDEHPVVCVSWNDALAFVQWLREQTGKAFRLPTEAEWEYAARAGSSTEYHFGNSESQLCRYANHATSAEDGYGNESCSDGVGKRTAVVGRYQPNSYGLYDMHGNVWEWAQDCWNDSYAGAPTDGSAWTLGDCSLRVLRGGSWFVNPRFLRSAYRTRLTRSSRLYLLGFRLAQDK